MSEYVSEKFAMFSAEGDGLVAKMMEQVIALPAAKRQAFLDRQMDAIGNAGHGEVFDTAVRDEIANAFEKNGIDHDALYF
jgi:hypothetical protein